MAENKVLAYLSFMRYSKILIFIPIFLLITDNKFSSFIKSINKNYQKYIFTFWEPKEKIPGFLKLCIKTWKVYIPDYEIIILDYNLSKQYLGEELFSNIICNNMSVMVQSDAIRVAMLYKYGGIWMDADTIITNGEFMKYFKNYEFSMVNEKNISDFNYIAFIYSSKNSYVIKQWLDQIIIRVKQFNETLLNKNVTNITIWQNSWENVNSWFYLGNGIIDFILRNVTGEKFLGIDKDEINVFFFFFYFKNTTYNVYQAYEYFYFRPGDPGFAINNTKGIIFLHNSWTTLYYKNMTEEEFLHQDILLAKLFIKLLNLTM